MNIRKSLPLFALTIIVLTLLAYVPSGAADENRVAVVVDFGNGQVAKRCVSFPEDHITGHEALERSGLPVETDFQSGGAAVCRIDGTGCPSNDCFCSCRGGGDNCVYWSYWHLTGSEWQYSLGGSGQYQVSDGAVDGWVWGLGSVTQAQPPPLVSFADVCTDALPATATVTPTPSRTAIPIIIMTATPVSDNPIAPTATVLEATAATLSPTLPAGVTPTLTTGIAATTIATGTIAAPLPTRQATTAPFTPAAPVDDDPMAQPPQTSGGFSAAAPTNAPQTPGPAMSVTASPTIAPQLTEPSGGIINSPAAIVALPESANATLPAIAAIIGAESVAAEKAVAQPAALSPVAAVTTADEPFNPLSYAGFAGLVLLLGALALLVYRRRVGASREVSL